jgi:hypothetical protein
MNLRLRLRRQAMSRQAELSVRLCTGRVGRLCSWCGGSVYGRMPCKRRVCPRYAPLWAYDWRIVLLENLIAYGGKAVLYTLTPPGVNALPWDRSRCSHAADVPCSGRLGCVIEEAARKAWNETSQKRLSRLYETVQAAVKREVGMRANVLAIGKEAQKRGAVHFHYALGVESALELRAAKAFRRHLERLSQKPQYGFGHMNGKFVRPRPAREAAAYLSSYFLGGRGHKAKLTEAVHNSELPRLPLYVSRRLTSVTRTTMRNKRRQRHLWACRNRGSKLPSWWSDLEERIDVLWLGVHVETRLQHAKELRAILGASP